MCIVSNIGDHYSNKFREPTYQPFIFNPSEVSKEDFEALNKEVKEMKRLLKMALELDEKTGQPECHMDEKVELLKKMAELVGVSLDDIFGKHNASS